MQKFGRSLCIVGVEVEVVDKLQLSPGCHNDELHLLPELVHLLSTQMIERCVAKLGVSPQRLLHTFILIRVQLRILRDASTL